MKTSVLPQQLASDGSEEIVIVAGPADARTTKRMAAGLLAEAATKPTPDELKAAILAALVSGQNVALTQNADGTVGVAVADSPDFTGAPMAPTAAPGTNTRQLATTAFVKAAVDIIANALAGKQATLIPGANIDFHDNGNGTFTISSTASGGASGLVDGIYGDVTVSGGGTTITVTRVTNGTVTVPDEAYAAAWQTKLSVPTKNAVYNAMEALRSSKVSVTAVGAANGVASLDNTGKVPAAQLPSYVDDVLEFSNTGAFPTPGETGKIYVALDTGAQWRWSGTAYVQLVASPGTTDNVVEGSTNKYYTDVRVRAAVMTGLVNTAGTPAATDSLLTVLGKLTRQAFGGYLLGVIQPVATTSISIDGASGTTRNLFWLNGGFYAADLSLQADNTTVAGNCSGAWSFKIQGAEQFRIELNKGLSVTCFDATYNVGVKQARSGQVGYHMFNGGGVAEWLTYQPAHASGDDYRIATFVGGTVTDRFKIGTDGTAYALGNLYAAQEIWAAGQIIRFGGAGSSHYLWWDNTNYQMPNGGLVVGGNISSSSDRRLKTDIRPLTDARAIVAAIGAYRFTMYGKPSVGVIAQEVEEVLPELVTADTGGTLSVDYGKLAAVLIADNNAMAARIASLEAMVAKLAA